MAAGALARRRSALIPGTSPYDKAIHVAVEHCRWCRGIGLGPSQVVALFAAADDRRQLIAPSWDQAVWALARAWFELPAPVAVIAAAAEQLVLPLAA